MGPGRLILLLLLAISSNCLLAVYAQHLKLGEACLLDNDVVGVCTRSRSCPSARKVESNGESLKVCSFELDKPIICCSKEIVQPIAKKRRPRIQSSTTPDPWKWSVTRPHQIWTPAARPPHILTPATAPPQRQPTAVRPPPSGTPATRLPQRRPTPRPSSGQRPQPTTNGMSRQKCKEYAKEVFREVNLPVLLFENDKVLEPDCTVNDHHLSVGGTISQPKEFPHMAALGYGDPPNVNWLCGGSLISDKFVLTAASCIYSADKVKVKWVRFGDLNMASKRDISQPQTISVWKTITHPRYKPTSFYHDIALIRLKRPVKFDAFVRPACLNTNALTPTGTTAVASGWGGTRHPGQRPSSDLLKFSLRFHPASRCNATYQTLISPRGQLARGFADEAMICVGDPTQRRDTCVGLSGDPLQQVLTEPYCMHNVVGVASFGTRKCGENDVPAVYTRVSHYARWIESIVWP